MPGSSHERDELESYDQLESPDATLDFSNLIDRMSQQLRASTGNGRHAGGSASLLETEPSGLPGAPDERAFGQTADATAPVVTGQHARPDPRPADEPRPSELNGARRHAAPDSLEAGAQAAVRAASVPAASVPAASLPAATVPVPAAPVAAVPAATVPVPAVPVAAAPVAAVPVAAVTVAAAGAGVGEKLEPGSLAALRARLERLPWGHPSSPYHVDGERKPPPPRLKHLELAPPAPNRFAPTVSFSPAGWSDQPTLLVPAAAETDEPEISEPEISEPEVSAAELEVSVAEPPRLVALYGDGEVRSGFGAGDVASAEAGAAEVEVNVVVEAEVEPARRPESAEAVPGQALFGDPVAEPPGGLAAGPALPVAAAAPELGPPEARLPVARLPEVELSQTQLPETQLPETQLPQTQLPPVGSNGHPRTPEVSSQPADRGDAGAPQVAYDGSWRWGAASLSADQARVANEAYDRFRVAEGRNLFGSYGSDGLTTAMRRIARQLRQGDLAPDTELNALLDPDTFRLRFADMLRRYPDRTADRLARRIPGAISYSFIFDAERYAEGIWFVQDALGAAGFQLLARRNDWNSTTNRCVATMWHDPANDVPFQVQFHTRASLEAQQLARSAAAMINDPQVPSAQAEHLRSDLAAAWAAASPPPGNSEIGDFRRESSPSRR